MHDVHGLRISIHWDWLIYIYLYYGMWVKFRLCQSIRWNIIIWPDFLWKLFCSCAGDHLFRQELYNQWTAGVWLAKICSIVWKDRSDWVILLIVDKGNPANQLIWRISYFHRILYIPGGNYFWFVPATNQHRKHSKKTCRSSTVNLLLFLFATVGIISQMVSLVHHLHPWILKKKMLWKTIRLPIGSLLYIFRGEKTVELQGL